MSSSAEDFRQKHTFSAVDLVVFVLSLALSCGLGLFYAIRGMRQKNQTREDLLLGGRNLPLLPTTLSLMSSVVSGILILAYPAQIYTLGSEVVWTLVAVDLALVFCAIFIIPVIYRSVESASVYEYIEKRFQSKLLRAYASLLFTLSMLIYSSVVLYAPSVALSGVTNIPTWALILSIGLVCTIYTSIGGLKAVVWADTVQAVVMYVGLLAMIISGTNRVGGFSQVMQIASEGRRLEGLLNIDPNPFQYMTVWTALLGSFFLWLSSFGANQMALQRNCSMSTVGKAQFLSLLTIPFITLIAIICFYLGFTMFAFYKDCDPLSQVQIEGKSLQKDQLVMYFMLELFSDLRGLPGLFLACLFSGTLSTVSSGINSLAAVGWEELGRYVEQFCLRKPLSEKAKTVITKILGVVFGLCSIGLAFAAESLGGIFHAVNSGLGAINGPMAGIVVLGVLVPWADWLGTLVGMVIGTVLPLTWFIYAQIDKYRPPLLPLSTENCTAFMNSTALSLNQTQISPLSLPPDSGDFQLSSLSVFMYPVLGAVPTLLCGIFISLLTKRNGDFPSHLLFFDKKSKTKKSSAATFSNANEKWPRSRKTSHEQTGNVTSL